MGMLAAGTPPILIRGSSPILAYITLESKYLSKGIRHEIPLGTPGGIFRSLNLISVASFTTKICPILTKKKLFKIAR